MVPLQKKGYDAVSKGAIEYVTSYLKIKFCLRRSISVSFDSMGPNECRSVNKKIVECVQVAILHDFVRSRAYGRM